MGASSLYLKAPQPKTPPRTTQDKSTMYVHNHGMLANDAMKHGNLVPFGGFSLLILPVV